MSLHFDPDQVRGFSNDVMTELDDVIRPWIAQIRDKMGTDGDYRTLGCRDGGAAGGYGPSDYSGRGVGFSLATNITDGLDWLSRLETGLEALSLSSAVFVEKLVSGDTVNAEDLELNAEQPKTESDSQRSAGGGGDFYAV